MHAMPDLRQYTHQCLQWLDTNVREPLKDTIFDEYIATPAKQWYCQWYKQP